MPLNVDALRRWNFEERSQTYTDKDTMLYALSVGFGADPLNGKELPFFYEQSLRAVPTMAAVLCHPGPWIGDPRTGATRAKVVHGEQRMFFHAPLPPAATLISCSRVIGVQDKGADKGALVHVERTLSNADTGQHLVSIIHTSFCRADGGFGEGFGPGFELYDLPDRAPDEVAQTVVREDAALLYRLNADRNPLHVDPQAAERAGYPRPILHGLCTYGIAARMLITHMLDHDPASLASIEARFSSVVYPGETLRFEFWRDGGTIGFQAFTAERGKKVLQNGKATIR